MRVGILVFVVLLASCSGKNKLDVDVSDVNVEIEVQRFDKELFQADIYDLRKLNSKWQSENGLLYEAFLSDMINVGLPQDPMITLQLEKFLTDSIMQMIGNKMISKFEDFSPYEQKLGNAFRYYSHYFPDSAIPEICTFYSNFNAKCFPMPTKLGIGLDMYIGKENEIVKNLPIQSYPQFLKNKMEPDFLVSETMKHWIYYKFSRPGEFQNNLIYSVREDFLSTIIFHGKMQYLLDALLPEETIASKFGYTEKELEWCNSNEKYLYQNLIELQLIYSTNPRSIVTYVNDGPSTPGLPDVSPAGVGKWIGYKMVKAYMEENEVSIQDMLSRENDARTILGFYRP